MADRIPGRVRLPVTTVWLTGQQSPRAQRQGRYLAESTQHPARMLPAIARHAIDAYTKPGELVADVCAAPGTKTTHLAQLMGNRGRIVAFDPNAARLRLVTQAASRLGVSIVETHVGGVAAVSGRWKDRCDRVLVDAPCTGSGTWRRRPDAKWRLTERQLEARLAEQAAILDAAAGFVRPGGRLVYVTCSVFDAENGDQIGALCTRHGGLSPLDHAALWEQRFPGRQELASANAERGIRLSPLKSGTDGFYVAALARTA